MAKGKIITKRKKKNYKVYLLNFKLETHKDGTAIYFREYLRDYMKNGLKKIKTRWIRL
jgi:penicillin-binding protein 1A